MTTDPSDRFPSHVSFQEKQESLVTMAGGVAHDFNNLLAAVLGNTNLILRRTAARSPIQVNLQQIRANTLLALELANKIAVFSGRIGAPEALMSVSDEVLDMKPLFRTTVPAHLGLECNVAARVPKIVGDPAQVRRAVLNLVINAAEAMVDANGRITVSVGFRRCGERFLRKCFGFQDQRAGVYSYVRVRDAGCAIPAAERHKIFDPFFSTKLRAPGLGLAVVAGIVRAHGGVIDVRNEKTDGSRITLFFPAANTSTPSSKKPKL